MRNDLERQLVLTRKTVADVGGGKGVMQANQPFSPDRYPL